MTPGAEAILESWSAPLGVNISLCLAVLIYTRGWLRLRTISPSLISRWPLVSFLVGILSVWIAIGSPLEAFDDISLTVHMAQHILLMAIAPPLILLGIPALLLLRGIPQSLARRVAGPFLRCGLVKWFGRTVTYPAVCWLAATFALIGWHVPTVFELALRWDWLHELEHACFLGAGLLFWWPVVQPWPSAATWPRWSVPLYLFCATLPCDVLSAFLAFCDRVVYLSYLSAPKVFNLSVLQDQEFAAVLMWVSVTIIFLVPAVVITIQLLSPPHASLAQEARVPSQKIAGQPLHNSKLEVV